METKYPVMQVDLKTDKNRVGVTKTLDGVVVGCDLSLLKDETTIGIVINGRVKHIIKTDGINFGACVISLKDAKVKL